MNNCNRNNLEGKQIHGLYLDLFPFAGTVIESRVKFGGQIQHTVKLDRVIEVFGAERDHVLVSDADDFKVKA